MKDKRREIFFENLGKLESLGKGRGCKFTKFLKLTKFTTTQFLVRSPPTSKLSKYKANTTSAYQE